MNIGWGTAAIIAGGSGLGVGVGTTLLDRPKEDRLGQSNGYISGRELAITAGATLGASSLVTGITAGMMSESAAQVAKAGRVGGVALGLGVAAVGTWIALATTSKDPGVSFDSIAYDLVDRYDHDRDGKLEGTLQPTLTPGNESTRTNGSTYMSIDRLLTAIDRGNAGGQLTATPRDITEVVKRFDANGDGRLQSAEQFEFEGDFGERVKNFNP